MRTAAVPGYRLKKSTFSTRVLTTFGLLGLFLGLIGASFLTMSRTGLSPSSVEAYYLGVQGVGTELDGLLVASTARSFGELADVTHIHLMGGSLLLFMLCHLLSVCEVEERTRTIWYSVSFLSFILTFTLPWLIVYVHRSFSYLYGVTILTLIVSLIILTVIPLREMWARR